MKKLHLSLFALAAFAVLVPSTWAQTAPKILVVDIGKVFNSHYARQEKEIELKGDAQKAEQEVEQLVKEGNGLVDQYKALLEQSKSPALTPEAKSKAEDDAKKKIDEINNKQNELNTFKSNAQRELQQREQNIRAVLIDEITRVSDEVAKRHNATIVLDKSGASIFGANVLVYSDPAYEITDEVIKEINKDHPASTPPSGTGSAAPSSNEPKVTVPGLGSPKS